MAERVGFDFEEIHFTESFLGAPEWLDNEMVVPARALYLCGGHPLADEVRPRSGLLIFGDVARSTRTVYEYTGGRGRDAFRPPYVVDDGGIRGEGDDLRDYRFGGVAENPHAWLEWTVRARYFELELYEA